MQKRVAQTLRGRAPVPLLFGLAAVGISVAFLAFLLITMAWKGLGGFSRTEARLTIDFARSDLMLEEATLRGPQAAARRSPTRALTACSNKPQSHQFGEGAGELFGDASTRSLGEQLIDDPVLVDHARPTCGFPCRRRPTLRPRVMAIPHSRHWLPRPTREECINSRAS